MPFLVDAKFIGAHVYLLPCLFAALSAGVYRLTHVVLVFMRRTKEVFFVSFIMLCVNVVVMYFFILFYGAAGAGYALAISFCLGSGLNLLTAYRYKNIAGRNA